MAYIIKKKHFPEVAEKIIPDKWVSFIDTFMPDYHFKIEAHPDDNEIRITAGNFDVITEKAETDKDMQTIFNMVKYVDKLIRWNAGKEIKHIMNRINKLKLMGIDLGG